MAFPSQPYASDDITILIGHLRKLCFDVTKTSSLTPLDNRMSNLSCYNGRTLVLNRPDTSSSGQQHVTNKPI